MGLKEAKEKVDSAPQTIKEAAPEAEAKRSRRSWRLPAPRSSSSKPLFLLRKRQVLLTQYLPFFASIPHLYQRNEKEENVVHSLPTRLCAFLRREAVLSIALLCAALSMLAVPPDAGYAGYIDLRVCACCSA